MSGSLLDRFGNNIGIVLGSLWGHWGKTGGRGGGNLEVVFLDRPAVGDWWRMEANVMRSVDTQSDDLPAPWYYHKEDMAWWINDHDHDCDRDCGNDHDRDS